LCGVVTHYAVLSAAFSAYDSGYSVIIARDCCMSGRLSMHEAGLKILNPISELMDHSEILKNLSKNK